MKVKMLVCMSSEKEVKNPGDIVEVKKEVGEAWEVAGIAEIIESATKSRTKKDDK